MISQTYFLYFQLGYQPRPLIAGEYMPIHVHLYLFDHISSLCKSALQFIPGFFFLVHLVLGVYAGCHDQIPLDEGELGLED